jgi:iron complex outermembrane receptor protein
MKRTPTAFLIDDDMDDHEIFSYAMEKADENVQCVFANDGIHALEKINSEEAFVPDFIFIDVNMPRMNGRQCLLELKKIDRLKNTPVFMYSTSADPNEIEENIKLGATDFIIKPSDVNDLSGILRRIVKRNIVPLIMLMFSISLIPARTKAQQPSDSIQSSRELKKLSVEALMNIVVTSVSKSPEKLSEVASAIQVVTGEEVRRSGTLRLPGVLRLATNMQVYSSGSHDTRITSRGFNGYPIANSSLANKLLVLIDGRSVYTPLFGGVYWDVQNVLQENIKQIEVISGPGGVIWGANAVNGIVNVITKSAKETQGTYASAASGFSLKDFGALQYGSHIDTSFYYRVYAQRFDFGSSTLSGGLDAMDAWNITQGGFRTDYFPSSKSTLTFQGDLYAGTEDDTGSTYVNGQNILGRWIHNFSSTSGLNVQAYFDRTYRNVSSTDFTDELMTYNIEMQHYFMIGRRNKIVWGADYRLDEDDVTSPNHEFTPEDRNLHLFSGFLQDQFSIVPEKLDLTLGTKLLENDFTGVEFHPTARLAWIPGERHTVWAAVSQGVRTPSRLERDLTGLQSSLIKKFGSEKVTAYELGYRMKPAANIFISLATFYNEYTSLRSLDTNYNPPPDLYFANNLEATTYGAEFSANVIAFRWWKIRGGYTWMDEKFRIKSDATVPQTSSFEAIDPKNQFLIQSLMDVAKYYQVDLTVRYVDVVPAAFAIPAVPSYFTFDMRLAWHYRWLTIAIVGQNLAQKTHGSSGTIEIPRSGFARLIVRF